MKRGTLFSPRTLSPGGDTASVIRSEAELCDRRLLRLEELVGLGDGRLEGGRERSVEFPSVVITTDRPQEPVHRRLLVPGPVGGDNWLRRGLDLCGTGDPPGGRLEQGERTNPARVVEGETESDQRAVGVPRDVGDLPADVIHHPHARAAPRRR